MPKLRVTCVAVEQDTDRGFRTYAAGPRQYWVDDMPVSESTFWAAVRAQ